MDGSQIEGFLCHASAKTARAHQRITSQLDFTNAGMKRDVAVRDFLTELEFARNELIDAAAAVMAIRDVMAIRELYRKAQESEGRL